MSNTIKMKNEVSKNIKYSAPIGAYGYRRGMLKFTYMNKQYKCFCSVSHALEIEEQDKKFKDICVNHLIALKVIDLHEQGIDLATH